MLGGGVARLGRNRHGRDLVVGDVHGERAMLEALLTEAGFDRARDRLLLVGDLVDRGPDSPGTVALTREPWCHSVRGNHDQDVLEVCIGRGQPIWGSEWVERIGAGRREEVRRGLEALPSALEVETAHGLLGIVHAGVPEGSAWPEMMDRLARGDEPTVREVQNRYCPGLHPEGVVAGVDAVAVGHMPVPHGVRRTGNHIAMETGAHLVRMVHEHDPEGAYGAQAWSMTAMEVHPARGRTWRIDRVVD